jgi:PEP-CTERM motif
MSIMKKFLLLIILSFTSASPAYAVTFVGNFAVSGMSGPISTINGDFQIAFDETQDRMLDFAPIDLNVQLGSIAFNRSDTLFDFLRLPQLQLQTGRFSLLFGRINAARVDSNNVVVTTTTLPDYTLRFLLDANFQFVAARGSYALPGIIQVFSFDTSAGDGSVARLTLTNLSAVPEPQIWFMMILGFGFVGIATRRRHRLADGRKPA